MLILPSSSEQITESTAEPRHVDGEGVRQHGLSQRHATSRSESRTDARAALLPVVRIHFVLSFVVLVMRVDTVLAVAVRRARRGRRRPVVVMRRRRTGGREAGRCVVRVAGNSRWIIVVAHAGTGVRIFVVDSGTGTGTTAVVRVLC